MSDLFAMKSVRIADKNLFTFLFSVPMTLLLLFGLPPTPPAIGLRHSFVCVRPERVLVGHLNGDRGKRRMQMKIKLIILSGDIYAFLFAIQHSAAEELSQWTVATVLLLCLSFMRTRVWGVDSPTPCLTPTQLHVAAKWHASRYQKQTHIEKCYYCMCGWKFLQVWKYWAEGTIRGVLWNPLPLLRWCGCSNNAFRGLFPLQAFNSMPSHVGANKSGGFSNFCFWSYCSILHASWDIFLRLKCISGNSVVNIFCG